LAKEGKIENTRKTIKTLVLTPTRELAIQIEENFTEYSENLNIKNMVLFG
jgi:ATP-dependent RNA helicase RhlE